MSWNAMLMAVSVAESDPPLSGEGHDREIVTTDDLLAIRDLIRRQIAAFHNEDLEEAWDLCSSELHEAFPSPEALARTVATRYDALLSATRIAFGELHLTPAGLGVPCTVTDAEGEEAWVVYVVQRAETGDFRVHGCILLDSDADPPALAA